MLPLMSRHWTASPAAPTAGAEVLNALRERVDTAAAVPVGDAIPFLRVSAVRVNLTQMRSGRLLSGLP